VSLYNNDDDSDEKRRRDKGARRPGLTLRVFRVHSYPGGWMYSDIEGTVLAGIAVPIGHWTYFLAGGEERSTCDPRHAMRHVGQTRGNIGGTLEVSGDRCGLARHPSS
jgi:hypothetical protein